MTRLIQSAVVPAIGLALLSAGGCATPGKRTGETAAIVSLQTLDPLAAQFNQDSGKNRFLALLSPT